MAEDKPRVLIVGAGFGGMRAAAELRTAPVAVTLVDRNNYHLFQPLLYQVATAGLEPEQVARPVRSIFREQENLRFFSAEVESIDLENKAVLTGQGNLKYDYLILSPGAEKNTFGLPGIESCALHLKDLGDAVQIRNHVLHCFERASWESGEVGASEWLTFVVVGGGPTGVEMAGSLAELVQYLLADEFRDFDASQVRILLLEMTERMLPGMGAGSSEAARKSLVGKGVEVRLGTAVRSYDGFRVRVDDGEELGSRTLIWAAGVQAARLLRQMPVEHGPQGRVVVDGTLQIPDYTGVFVIGDGAYVTGQGRGLPMMAPVALQMAEQAAANIANEVRGLAPRNFQYRDPGRLATIGRNAAVAELGRFHFKGFFAWVVWLIVHLVQLVGFRNRLMVLISWAWEYLTYERAVRLIEGPMAPVSELEGPGECT